MARIGEIATIVTAKTAPFSKGMRHASGEAKKFGKVAKTDLAGTMRKNVASAFARVTSMVTSPTGIIAAFASAAYTAKRFGDALARNAAELDSIGKLSTRIGLSTRELMGLQFVAGQSGVEFSQLQKSLEAFNKRLGESAMGVGEAARAYETLGIDVKEFMRLPLHDRLGIISDKLAGMESQSMKAAVASRLFSRQGAGPMLNLLQLGSENLDALTTKFENLGAALDSHVVKAIERTNDALDVQSQRMKGLWRQLTGELWPAMGYMLETLDKRLNRLGVKDPKSSLVRSAMDLALEGLPLSAKGIAARTFGQRVLAGGDILKQEERGTLLDQQLAKHRNQAPGPAQRNSPEQRTLYEIWQSQERGNKLQEEQIRRMWSGETPIVDHF